MSVMAVVCKSAKMPKEDTLKVGFTVFSASCPVLIIIGVTGASGVEMSYYLLKALKSIENCEIHLVISDGEVKNWELETDRPLEDLLSLADIVHYAKNMAASISSGSFIMVYKEPQVILVNYEDCEIGVMGKDKAHREARLHRAFSAFLYRGQRILLQKRASGKYHCGGLWTNTCCSHTRPGENVSDAAIRRLQEGAGAPYEPYALVFDLLIGSDSLYKGITNYKRNNSSFSYDF